MKIAYRAIDGGGSAVADVIEAPSIAEAAEQLRRDGLFVTEVQEAGRSAKPSRGTRRQARRGGAAMRLRDLLLFTRQMAMLLKAGSPVVPALDAIARPMKGSGREIVDTVRRRMESGRGLSESLKEFPETFSDVYIAILGAGEASANLPEMFSRLAELVAYRRDMRNRVLAAMAYPALLILLSVAIVVTMVAFVVPRFKVLFESLDTTLPMSTQVMFGIAFLIRDHWLWALGGGGVALVAGGLTYYSGPGRQWLTDLKTRLPLAGKMYIRLLQAQMFRVMGLLLESRVGIMETLHLSSGISSNRDYRTLCQAMHDELEGGGRLSAAMARSALISPTIAQAVSTGEESGRMDQAMLFVADVMDEENAQMIGTATKMMEPLILIIMGMVVGGIALSLFIPLFDLAAMAD